MPRRRPLLKFRTFSPGWNCSDTPSCNLGKIFSVREVQVNLALFDFDGTISNRDSFLYFLWSVNSKKMIRTCVSSLPGIVLYLAKSDPGTSLKEAFLTKMLAGHQFNALKKRADDYCSRLLPGIIRDGFWPCLQRHQSAGDSIYIVSASPRFMLEPWCRRHQLKLIGTELETDAHGCLTGKLAGNNCKGVEKVERIVSEINLEKYVSISAYGDTPSDQPMLELADTDQRFYKPFR